MYVIFYLKENVNISAAIFNTFFSNIPIAICSPN
jgi:hypothetical protein